MESRVVASTAGCAAECARPARIVDVLADDTAHEAKVGYTMLTPAVEKQIRADAHLIESGLVERARWHFFASSESRTIGASTEVLNLLAKLDIEYTLHLPG